MSAVLFFYCGIIAQAFFLIRKKLTLLHTVLIPTVFFSCILIASLPSSKESHYNTFLHFFMGAILFSIAYAVWFKKDILQKVRKEVLFLWFFILLSLIIKDFTAHFFILKVLVIIFSLPIILGMFFPLGEKYGMRVYSYVWFLCTLLFVSSSQFIWSDLSFFIKHGQGLPQSPFIMFFTGSSFLYIMVTFWYIFEILPIPAKKQSMRERLEEIREDFKVLSEHYDSKARLSSRSFLLTCVSCTLITVNAFFPFMKTETVVAIALTLLPYLSSLLEQEELNLSSSTDNNSARTLSTSLSAFTPQSSVAKTTVTTLLNGNKEIITTYPSQTVTVTKTVNASPEEMAEVFATLPPESIKTETKVSTVPLGTELPPLLTPHITKTETVTNIFSSNEGAKEVPSGTERVTKSFKVEL